MSGTNRNLEAYVTSLCQRARDLGASQAKAVPIADIVVDERALLKCLVPICSHYGVDLVCPPNVLPVSQFREILKRYHNAILIKVDVPSDNLPAGKKIKLPEAPKSKNMRIFRDAQKKLLEIVGQIESVCITEGYPFAAGFTGGSCPLCEECVGVKSGLPCRYPFKARPAMEAMGIDVVATARRVGVDLDFAQGASRSWVGLVLVD